MELTPWGVHDRARLLGDRLIPTNDLTDQKAGAPVGRSSVTTISKGGHYDNWRCEGRKQERSSRPRSRGSRTRTAGRGPHFCPGHLGWDSMIKRSNVERALTALAAFVDDNDSEHTQLTAARDVLAADLLRPADPWVCGACGSTSVLEPVYVSANTGEITSDFDPETEPICPDCHEALHSKRNFVALAPRAWRRRRVSLPKEGVRVRRAHSRVGKRIDGHTSPASRQGGPRERPGTTARVAGGDS